MPDDDIPENVIPMQGRKKRPKFKPTEAEIGRILREEVELGEGTMFRLDTFSGQTLMMRPIPRPGVGIPKKFAPHDCTDVDITHLIEWLTTNGASKDVSRARVDAAVQAEGHRNAFSSARAALDTLPAWDGVERINAFLTRVCGAVAHEPGMDDLETWKRSRYLEAVGRVLFIGIVARILQPGCKLDTIVILEGPQGTLKSTLLRALAFDNDEWFSDSMVTDLGSKDARQHLRGKMIVELAEMSQLKGSKVESLKAFISARDDKYRPSYGRRDVMYPRQCVFVGTTNHSDYLVDFTGNRRFLPVQCGTIDIGTAQAQMHQLYAEAIQAWRNHEPWWLPADLVEIAEVEQRQRRTDDPWETQARDLVEERKRTATGMYAWVRTTDLLTKMLTADKHDRAAEMRAGQLLAELGGVRKKMPRNEGWPSNGYRFEIEPQVGRGRQSGNG